MIKFFVPPNFLDDEKKLKAQIFSKIVYGTLAVVSITEIILCFVAPQNLIRWVSIFVFANLSGFFLISLHKKGYSKLSSYIFIFSCIASNFILAWFSGGIKSYAIDSFPVIVLFSGLLLGWRKGLITALITVLLELLLVIMELLHLLPYSTVIHNPFSIWILSIAIIASFSLIQFFTVVGLNNALVDSQKEVDLRRITENKLRKSEEFKNRVFESSSIAIVVMDPISYKVIDCNQSAVKIFGFSSKDELLTSNHLQLSAPMQYDNTSSESKIKFYFNKVIDKGSIQYEWKYIKPNGEFWDAEIHLVSFLNENNKLVQFTLTDITESKKNKEALVKSEQNYREIFNSTSEAIFIDDAFTGKMIDVNDAMLKIYGYSSKEEVLAGDIGNLSANIEPYTEEVAQQHIQKTISQGPQTFEWLAKKKDGSHFWIEMTLKKTDIGGSERILAVGRDISERKRIEMELIEKEEKFSKIFYNNPTPCSLTDLKTGIYVDVNDAFCTVSGYSKNEVIGKTAVELGIMTSEARKEIFSKVDTNGKGSEIEADLFNKNKDKLNFLLFFETIVVRGQKLNYTISYDITERKKFESELEAYHNHLKDLVTIRTEKLNIAYEELYKQLEKEKEYQLILSQSLEKEKELSQMKSSFVSTASHEFRTPLTSILSSAELLQRYGSKWSNEKKEEHVDRIRRKVDYMTKLLDDVLLINKAESGQISLSTQTVNLKELVEECIQDSASISNDSVQVLLNYLSKKNNFMLDKKLIKSIIDNLLSNAIKFSMHGGLVNIIISDGDNILIIEISDNGIGISESEIHNVFQPFYRASNIKAISGTGLGLSIVKRAVDIHGGEISLRSHINNGTTFIVRIPINA